MQMAEDSRNQQLAKYRGMFRYIYIYIYNALQLYGERQIENIFEGWVGLFSTLDIILRARGVLNDGHMLFFTLSKHGRLEYATQEDAIL